MTSLFCCSQWGSSRHGFSGRIQPMTVSTSLLCVHHLWGLNGPGGLGETPVVFTQCETEKVRSALCRDFPCAVFVRCRLEGLVPFRVCDQTPSSAQPHQVRAKEPSAILSSCERFCWNEMDGRVLRSLAGGFFFMLQEVKTNKKMRHGF